MKKAAAFFKVLADEARLNMLWLLLNHRELCVCDFMAVLEVTQSKASRHLRILYNAGLVTDRRVGLWIYYSLQPAADDFVRTFLETLRSTLAHRQEAVELLKKLDIWLEQKDQTKCS
ncbi:MAG: metalloregulator ArsR/SmtB family transcription factor [Deltaproteobacteria bacterium]|nr:metalloregulator ArsR/SmtB family transcription factor [Deltaproteobacteria bacterium]